MAALIRRGFRRNVAVSSWSQSLVCGAMSQASTVGTRTKNLTWHRPPWQKLVQNQKAASATTDYRFIFPEFLPKVDPVMRNSLREKLERADMLNRRKAIEIPEFYVGTIMAVTVSDRCSPGKVNRFVGICIHRGGEGLRACFTLRNVVDHQGVEIMYEMYNPTIQQIEVLRLEKRLDDELFYLRDAPAEFSTFPFDLLPQAPVGNAGVPVNLLKVKLNPRPWHDRWERKELKGVEDLCLPQKFYEKAQKIATPWLKYDLMREYRRLIPEEEQAEIYTELHIHKMEASRRSIDKRVHPPIAIKEPKLPSS